MERLTKVEESIALYNDADEGFIDKVTKLTDRLISTGASLKEAPGVAREMLILSKLAEYEDLEEQGRLIRLPVAEGTEVYQIIGVFDSLILNIIKTEFDRYMLEGWNNTVFLTRQEAEARIKELESFE